MVTLLTRLDAKDEAAVTGNAATEPNAMINLAYVAGLLLAVGLLVLGVGLIRGRRTASEAA